MHQLDLFNLSRTEEIRLRVAAEQTRQRVAAQRHGTQQRFIVEAVYALQFELWGEPVRLCAAVLRPARVMQQTEMIPAAPLAAASVFALAAARPTLGHKWWRQPATAASPYRVERDGDRIRLIRMQPQETEEWQEREQRRRAKQKPPRPTKGARTRSSKLMELIGDDGDA